MTSSEATVGVVAYEMEGARSGVGRYLEGLLRGAAQLADAGQARHAWKLFLKGDPFEHPLFEHPAIEPIFDQRPRAKPIRWEQLRLPWILRRHRLDLLFSPGYSLPPCVPVPKVVTLHDLSFEHLRQEFRWREGLRRRVLARSAAQKATRVLVDTTAMSRDLAATYRLEPSKIGVVPLAVDERFFSPGNPEPAATDLHVPGPYVLALGSILPRRRLDLAIRAFTRAAPENTHLLIAGRNRLVRPEELGEWIAASRARDRIRHLDYVPEEALPGLYAGAEATLYLSAYEGYGLPPLESLAAGTAALVSPGMALDDLLPDYPYRAILEEAAVTETLRRLLTDPGRPEVIEASRERLRELTWKSCAKRFLTELEEVA